MRLVFWGLVIAGLVVLGVRWLAGQDARPLRSVTTILLPEVY